MFDHVGTILGMCNGRLVVIFWDSSFFCSKMFLFSHSHRPLLLPVASPAPRVTANPRALAQL